MSANQLPDVPVVEVRRRSNLLGFALVATVIPLVVGLVAESALFGDAPGRVLRLAIVIAVAVLVLWLGIRRGRLLITRERFGRRGWLGTRWTPRNRLARSVLIASIANPNGPDARMLFIFDRDGKLVARLSGTAWGNDGLATVIEALALPFSAVPDRLTVKEIAALEPNAFRWYERLG